MNHLKVASIILQKDEGSESRPYYCSEGYPTIGIGFVIGKKGDPLPDVYMSEQDAIAKLNRMIIDYDLELSNNKIISKAYSLCDNVRKAVLLSMRHQLGLKGLCEFKKMITAIESKDWAKAADECLDSKAAKQARNRFLRNSAMLKTGILDHYYD